MKIAACIAAALVALSVPAQAQTYPAREIHVIVGLPAGSGGDVVTRYYADKLSRLAGKPAIVENRPGMILSLGADAVAKAPPDGYAILITSVTSSHAANMFMFKKLPYDPIKDFTPVAMLQKSYFMLMVPGNGPYNTVAELTEAMKKKGDKASYAYGSPPALASAESYKARAGLKAVGIPYKTSVGSLSEMFSGEIDFQFIDSTVGTPLREGGKLRALAVTSGQRVQGVDIPTMAEAASIPEFDIAPVWGVLLPAGAPPEIVSKLEGWFAEISKMDDTRKFVANTHAALFPGGAKDLAAFIPKEIEKWRGLAEIAKIQPQ
jgi:tripartite-type tricarboxylate transporter receptor subunit TctC